MSNSRINDCPICGSEKIDMNRLVIGQLPNRKEKVQTWCFCRNCGHRGMLAIGIHNEEEGKAQAIRLWNQEG